MSTSVTVIAPPMRVATCANGINTIRLAAVRMATSPVPPCPLCVALMMAVSTGYIFSQRPTTNPVAINDATVAKMVMTLAGWKAATSLSHGVIATPNAQTKQERKGSAEQSESDERGEQGEEGEEGNAVEQARLQRQAKITMEQAREIALRRAAGNVEGGELEREHGHLVYSFDIRNAKGTITEVQVDAKSGKVVRVEEENKK